VVPEKLDRWGVEILVAAWLDFELKLVFGLGRPVSSGDCFGELLTVAVVVLVSA
jgi:hypothetical protein